MSLERATSQPIGQAQQKLLSNKEAQLLPPYQVPCFKARYGCWPTFWRSLLLRTSQGYPVLSTTPWRYKPPLWRVKPPLWRVTHPRMEDPSTVTRLGQEPALTTTLRLSVPRFGPRQTDHWGQSYQFYLFLSYTKADTAAFPCCGKAPKDQVLSMTTILQDSWFSQEKSFIYNHEVWRILLNPIMYLFTTTSKLLVINLQGKSCL